MKAVILYSKHDNNQDKIEQLKQSLSPRVSAVDVVDVCGSETGIAINKIFAPREFPVVIFIHDFLQGVSLDNLGYLEAVIMEQQDIDEREYHQRVTDFIGAKLFEAKKQGKVELYQELLDTQKIILDDISKEYQSEVSQ